MDEVDAAESRGLEDAAVFIPEPARNVWDIWGNVPVQGKEDEVLELIKLAGEQVLVELFALVECNDGVDVKLLLDLPGAQPPASWGRQIGPCGENTDVVAEAPLVFEWEVQGVVLAIHWKGMMGEEMVEAGCCDDFDVRPVEDGAPKR